MNGPLRGYVYLLSNTGTNEAPKYDKPKKINYTDGEQKGVATLITATGGGQTASVVLMTNTDKYQNEMLAFVKSLSLSANTSANQNSANNSNTKNASITGMWVFYNTESSGISNGIPQLTGGYMRREYVFYQDGTYQFPKNWNDSLGKKLQDACSLLVREPLKQLNLN